ncbi:TIGR04086 family membrane protein [Pantoea sp. Mb-10]|uniref:TIGR04086 family membrane protein n=1 Tax=unclassified Pantoea TaxID=2630326 RepID=UPI001E41F5D3|nr:MULTISPECIES: TIGR04086 family membrane protein [unclassified Pantoea]MCE0489173.1 TIGR04086 family membrane protein [Pantoea sp. Mb-10]MCE0503078.1 TIGR04086 family membrane protein [Pantoea sp. Pb-8]
MPETWTNNGTKEIITETHSALPLKRISWSAVFAGVIAALIVHILLGLLGTAIGATTIDPQQEQNPLQHLGTGALIWSGVSMLIAMAVGSYVAGRLAQREGALHGLLMFGVSTVITLWLAISLASGIIGGAFNILGSGMNALGSGISAVAPSVTNMAKEKLQENNINLDDLKGELETTLRQTGKPELQPENLKQDANSEANNAENQAKNTAQNPQNADTDIANWLKGVINRHSDTLQAADRDALKNIIKARTGKSDAEAEQIVNQTEQSYQKAVQQYQQLKQEAEQKAREAAEKAAAATAKASWFAFFMLLIEAVLAAVVGRIGRRTQPREVLTHERH